MRIYLHIIYLKHCLSALISIDIEKLISFLDREDDLYAFYFKEPRSITKSSILSS
jgi:hypothetical protein